MASDNRIYRFDNVKVWLMLLVIVAHTLIASFGVIGDVEYIRFICLCYTMPLFTFISGYLSKREQSLASNVRHLLLPCIIFTVINDGVQLLVNPDYHIGKAMLLIPGFSMWYLWVLFVYRVSLPYLLRIKGIFVISLVASWVVGFCPYFSAYLSLSRMVCFLPFFLAGHYIARDASLNRLKNSLLTNVKWGGYLLVLILVYAAWFYFISIWPGQTYATGFAGPYMGHPVLKMCVRIALQVTVAVTGWCILMLFPNRQTFFTKYGSRTLYVYLLHGMVVLPFAYAVFPHYEDGTCLSRILMIAVPTLLCCLLFHRRVASLMQRILPK